MTGGAQPAVPGFVRELDTLVRARYPLLYLLSFEEARLDAILQDLAKAHGKAFFTWSVTRGLRRGEELPPGRLEGRREPLAALADVANLTEPALVVLKDFHPFLSDPAVVRALRELGQAIKAAATTVVLLSPVLQLPPELEKEVTVLDIPLPGAADLVALLKEIVTVVREGGRAVIDLTAQDAEALVKSALGLTLSEAENAFARAIAWNGRLDRQDVALILEEKRQIIRKSGLLEYHPAQDRLEDVGGADLLKRWLARRGGAFGEAARRFGLPEPRGLLLLGVQGCGKSLTAKAVAHAWRLPLLRLDMGRIFSGLVGSSEENLRRAIRVAESVAPAVLWVDEIEKALSGSLSSNVSDAGVTARIFGALLTWLAEKTAPVFVVATANRIDALPPELLRKGRFDDIFFVDLPAAAERREIFRIHLRRRGRDADAYDTGRLAAGSAGFSGAEIEAAVISALHDAFAEGAELSQGHVERAVAEAMPLATTLREEVERVRGWARTRTRAASALPPEAVPPPGARR